MHKLYKGKWKTLKQTETEKLIWIIPLALTLLLSLLLTLTLTSAFHFNFYFEFDFLFDFGFCFEFTSTLTYGFDFKFFFDFDFCFDFCLWKWNSMSSPFISPWCGLVEFNTKPEMASQWLNDYLSKY